MSSCLRMALAFSTATSSAKLNSSVGDFVFKSCSFISCMRCYSKTETGWFKDFAGRDISSVAFGEGGRICLGGKANVHRLLHSGRPDLFWGKGRAATASRSGCDSFIADHDGGRNSLAWLLERADHDEDHDQDHEQRR